MKNKIICIVVKFECSENWVNVNFIFCLLFFSSLHFNLPTTIELIFVTYFLIIQYWSFKKTKTTYAREKEYTEETQKNVDGHKYWTCKPIKQTDKLTRANEIDLFWFRDSTIEFNIRTFVIFIIIDDEKRTKKILE